jgi:hypothetical protein
MIEPSLTKVIKELRINLRLFHGYKAADLRKMTDQQVLLAYKEAIKDVRIEGCSTKPFTSDWWNIMANKAIRQARYNIKYKKVAKFCWDRSERRESYKCIYHLT